MRSREMRDLVVIVIVIALFMGGVTGLTSKYNREQPATVAKAGTELPSPKAASDVAMTGPGAYNCNQRKTGSQKWGGRHHHRPPGMGLAGRPVRAADLAEAREKLAAGRGADAMQVAERLVRLNVNDANVWVLRAECDEALGQSVRALDDVQTALRLDNRNVGAWRAQVTILENLDRKREADESRQKVAELGSR